MPAGLHTLDLSSQHVNDPVDFTMTVLTAMEHNHTMMRLVLPANVYKYEPMIENKTSKINEKRNKEGMNKLILESLRFLWPYQIREIFLVQRPVELPVHRPVELHVHGPVELPVQRPVQRYQRRHQMQTTIRNVPPPRI